MNWLQLCLSYLFGVADQQLETQKRVLAAMLSSGCKLWFTSTDKQNDYCKGEWSGVSIVVSIAIIVFNFFILLVLMSFAFDLATQGKVNGPKSGNQAMIQQPLNSAQQDDGTGTGGAPAAASS